MIEKIIVEWKYDPKDYFEDKIHISNDKYELDINNGEAEARIDPEIFDNAKDILNEIISQLESRFLAVQVMTHRPFNLSKPSRYDLRSDGTRNIYLNVEPAIIKISTGTVDLVVKDKEGNIIADTKAERIDKKKWFAETATK